MAASTVAEQMLWTSSAQVASFLRLVTAREDAEAKRIGQLIAQLRERQGWSQQDLAHEIGVHLATVSRWERGENKGYAGNVRKLAKALKVRPALLQPADPEVETQLDRIEAKVDRLLVLSAEEAGSSDQPDEGVADALARLPRTTRSRPKRAAGRPASAPATRRRKPA